MAINISNHQPPPVAMDSGLALRAPGMTAWQVAFLLHGIDYLSRY
jgi:hypothetical protein